LLGFSVSEPVAALIVSDGQVVEAWPEASQPPRVAPSGAAFAETKGFFPNPKGTIRSLTLLVSFSDEQGAFTREEIDAWLNEPGYSRFNAKGSVRDYYKDVSNGAVDIVNTVHVFYRAKNPKSYYEGGSGYQRAGELMQELLAAVDADVDFSQYDNDGDGRTEAINVVYAGPAVEWGQGLWPHAGSLNQKRDGVTLSRYQMTNMGTSLGLYTFAHETGHMVFGWPDLYGFGDYCLMGNATNAANPAGINDFFRADQGWIPQVDVEAGTNANLTAAVNGAGYRFVNPSNQNELFFWSNIQNKNRWSVLRGSGLLFLHYDGRIRGNEPPNPLQLAVVQADGKKDLDKTTWPSPGSDTNDFFRGGGRTEFSSKTTPPAAWNDGTASGLRVHSIGASGEQMTFSVGTGVAGAPSPSGGAGGMGGAPPSNGGTGGASGRSSGGATSGGAGPAASGAPSSAGMDAGSMSGNSGTAGTSGSFSSAGQGSAGEGGKLGVGGTPASSGGPSSSVGGATVLAGTSGIASAASSDGDSESGCSVSRGPRAPHPSALLSALCLAAAFGLRRRRARRSRGG
jgi:M6 family metalloprotease-like protein